MDMTVRRLVETHDEHAGKEVVLKGWVRNHRAQKAFGFINVNDGTCFETIQVVYEEGLTEDFALIRKVRTGAAVEVAGEVVLTPQRAQPFEIKARTVRIIGDSPEDYPLQPKRHSREFLRKHAHLRGRTNLFTAVFRIRSLLTHAIHEFFQSRDFLHLASPIITASDAEGAGEMFRVTTLTPETIKKQGRDIDYTEDFFGKKTNLTVSGQLQAEAFAQAFRAVYTFGPTFRAEKSHTSTHASEFWMVEPEVAFADLDDIMELSEDMVKEIIGYVLKHAEREMAFLDRFVEKGLIKKLEEIVNSEFHKVTHKEAVAILTDADSAFDTPPEQGGDLATEHEKALVEHFGGPVFVTDWPKDIKAFYMRLNEDEETVAACDLLVPGAGEIIGASQREERHDILQKRMRAMGVDEDELAWYLELRRYGSVPHAGFGLGFDRMLMYITGVKNIRDVIPFPRTPKNCAF